MEWLFAVSFLTLRLFVAPVWLEMLLQQDMCPFHLKIGTALIYFISQGWNVKILIMLVKRLKEMGGKNPSQVVMFAHSIAMKFGNDKRWMGGYLTIVGAFCFIYPAIYYGYYRQTLFLSY